MSLEKARYKDPWELITNPTLLPNAISPSRKGLLAFGLISGFSIGSLYCGLQDKKSNLIFSKIKMREFKGKFHNYISWKNKIASEKSLNIFAKSKFLHNIEEIALHPVGSLDDILIDLIMESLNKNQNNCAFIKKSDLSDALELENIVLLTQLGVTKKDELIDTNRLINIQSKNNIGMITLEA